MKRQKTDWSPKKVMSALRARGTNINQLAKQYGCSRQALYQTLRATNHRGELRIAHALGEHPMAIWPSRYDTAGEPRGGRYELKPIPNGSACGGGVNGNLKRAA